jgi:hypothetical protein
MNLFFIHDHPSMKDQLFLHGGCYKLENHIKSAGTNSRRYWRVPPNILMLQLTLHKAKPMFRKQCILHLELTRQGENFKKASPPREYKMLFIARRSFELSVKYVQKRKLRANFMKTGVSSSQGAKRSLVVVL